MEQPSDSIRKEPSLPEPQRRINTQIHRRKKAKAVMPLIKEWEGTSPAPPVKLRMPPERMRKH